MKDNSNIVEHGEAGYVENFEDFLNERPHIDAAWRPHIEPAFRETEKQVFAFVLRYIFM